MSNIETVQRIYRAYGEEDMETILGLMSPDVEWERHPTGNSAQDHDVPYLRHRQGREAVPEFFAEIDEDFEMDLFRPHTFLEGDDHVAVVIENHLTVKSTGKEVHDEEIRLWGFDADGKIISHRHFLDTHKAIAARR